MLLMAVGSRMCRRSILYQTRRMSREHLASRGEDLAAADISVVKDHVELAGLLHRSSHMYSGFALGAVQCQETNLAGGNSCNSCSHFSSLPFHSLSASHRSCYITSSVDDQHATSPQTRNVDKF
jgi:hypothetical protein